MNMTFYSGQFLDDFFSSSFFGSLDFTYSTMYYCYK